MELSKEDAGAYAVFKLRYGNEVKRVLAALGPERVSKGMRAFERPRGQGWQDCFLALTYGDVGELALIRNRQIKVAVHQLLELEQEGVTACMTLFDMNDVSRAVLLDLCEEYLEQNVVKPIITTPEDILSLIEELTNVPAQA